MLQTLGLVCLGLGLALTVTANLCLDRRLRGREGYAEALFIRQSTWETEPMGLRPAGAGLTRATQRLLARLDLASADPASRRWRDAARLGIGLAVAGALCAAGAALDARMSAPPPKVTTVEEMQL